MENVKGKLPAETENEINAKEKNSAEMDNNTNMNAFAETENETLRQYAFMRMTKQ